MELTFFYSVDSQPIVNNVIPDQTSVPKKSNQYILTNAFIQITNAPPIQITLF